MFFDLEQRKNPELVARGQNINYASNVSHNFRNLYSIDASHNTDSIHFSATGKSAWSLFCEVALEATNSRSCHECQRCYPNNRKKT